MSEYTERLTAAKSGLVSIYDSGSWIFENDFSSLPKPFQDAQTSLQAWLPVNQRWQPVGFKSEKEVVHTFPLGIVVRQPELTLVFHGENPPIRYEEIPQKAGLFKKRSTRKAFLDLLEVVPLDSRYTPFAILLRHETEYGWHQWQNRNIKFFNLSNVGPFLQVEDSSKLETPYSLDHVGIQPFYYYRKTNNDVLDPHHNFSNIHVVDEDPTRVVFCVPLFDNTNTLEELAYGRKRKIAELEKLISDTNRELLELKSQGTDQELVYQDLLAKIKNSPPLF